MTGTDLVVVACMVLVLLIPLLDLGSPRRRRGGIWALAILCVVATASGVVYTQVQCPECFDQCCPDFVPYGICWPVGWWPC